MTDQKHDQPESKPRLEASRRKLLKGVAAGGGIAATLPRQWTKPVVESVLLPAHAQVSLATLSCQSVGQQMGSNTAPGPAVPVGAGVNLAAQLTVTPPPPAGFTATVETFLNNAPQTSQSVAVDPVTGLTPAVPIFVNVIGTVEMRFTFASMTCSVFWNVVLG